MYSDPWLHSSRLVLRVVGTRRHRMDSFADLFSVFDRSIDDPRLENGSEHAKERGRPGSGNSRGVRRACVSDHTIHGALRQFGNREFYPGRNAVPLGHFPGRAGNSESSSAALKHIASFFFSSKNIDAIGSTWWGCGPSGGGGVACGVARTGDPCRWRLDWLRRCGFFACRE
jgi:hypothetical protein